MTTSNNNNTTAAAAAAAYTKEQARKGFAAAKRPDAWLVLSGGMEMKEQAATPYSVLAACTSTLAEECVFAVEDDVRSAMQLFRQQGTFSTAKGAEALSRMLFAFAARNGGSYMRSQAHVAALLLLVFGKEREEHAFWTLAALYERRLFPHCKGEVRVTRAHHPCPSWELTSCCVWGALDFQQWSCRRFCKDRRCV